MRTNWKLITDNIAEARDTLQRLEESLGDPKTRNQEQLQVSLEHALHHLYFGWNARYASAPEYRHLAEVDFNRWSKVPTDLSVSRKRHRK